MKIIKITQAVLKCERCGNVSVIESSDGIDFFYYSNKLCDKCEEELREMDAIPKEYSALVAKNTSAEYILSLIK